MKRSLLATALVLSLSACDGGEPAADLAFQRLIEEPPASFDAQAPADLYEVETTAEWAFDEDETSHWSLAGDANRLVSRPGHLLIFCDAPPCTLSRKVELPDASVDVIEVRLAVAAKSSARFGWSVEGGPVAPELELTERILTRGTETTVRFEVARNPGWAGRITRLTLDPTKVAGQWVRVFSIRGLKYRLPEDRQRRLASVPWGVELDGEIRPAWLALPGLPLEWRTTIPDQASLSFGTAVPATWREPALFEIIAAGKSGPALFSATRAPGDGWRDHTVDLSGLAGGDITLEMRVTGPDTEPVDGFAAWSSPEISAPLARKGPNIVLISVDTLRADHVSFAGYERPTTPRIDRFLAQRGVWFRSVVTSAPWTLPAHVSLMTGVDSLNHGVNHQSPMPSTLETLATSLRGHGYHTAALTGGGWLSGRYGLSRGFERYRAWPFGKSRRDELRDNVDRFIEWLPSSPQPFFLFLHTFETHSPHDRHQPFGAEDERVEAGRRTLFFDSPVEARREAGFALEKRLLMGRNPRSARPVESAEDWERAIAAYDNGIRHMDSQIGRLLEALEPLGPTLVVLTSDHGEALGERGLASHGYLYDHNLLVPLVIASPDEEDPGRAIDQQVRLVDLAPTILDFAGVPVPSSMDGRSLRRLLTTGRDEELPRVATSYATASNLGLALRTANRRKYVFNNTPWPPVAGSEAVFDVRADPGEGSDLLSTLDAEELEQLRGLARAALTSRATGPILELRNRGRSVFSGSISGRCMQPLRVTSPTAGSAELTWQGSHATFSVAAGSSIALHLEAPSSPCLTIEGKIAGGPILSAIVDDPGTTAAFGRTLDGNRFEPIDDRDELEVGFWFAPTTASVGDGEPILDDDLRRQLEDLGYLN